MGEDAAPGGNPILPIVAALLLGGIGLLIVVRRRPRPEVPAEGAFIDDEDLRPTGNVVTLNDPLLDAIASRQRHGPADRGAAASDITPLWLERLDSEINGLADLAKGPPDPRFEPADQGDRRSLKHRIAG